MTVDYKIWYHGYQSSETSEVHVTVYGTHAYFFIQCADEVIG